MKHLEQLRSLNACREAIEWASAYPDLEQAWKACPRPDWMLWLLGKKPPEKRISVAIACEIARTVLHLVPEGEDRPRKAIEAAEAWLIEPTEERRKAAARADARAARAAARAAAWAEWADWAEAAAAAEAAAWAAEAAAAEAAAEAADAWAASAAWAARAAKRVRLDVAAVVRRHHPLPPSLD